MARRRPRLPVDLSASLLAAGLLAALPSMPPPAAGQEVLGPLPELSVQVERISDRLLVLDCMDVNVTAVATASGVVLIDTQRSPSLMSALVPFIEIELGQANVTHIINTHGHPDHASGNQVFPSAVSIAHADCPEFMRHNPADAPGAIEGQERLLDEVRTMLRVATPGSAEAEQLAAEIRGRELLIRDLREQRYVFTPPVEVFDDRRSLEAGGVRFELAFAGRAHTNHDLLVHIPDEHVLLTGDLFCSARSFCFAVTPLADVTRLVAELDRILAADPELEVVIPGHGPPLTRTELVGLRSLLLERYAEFDGRRSAAARLDTLIQEQGLAAALAAMPPGAGEHRPTTYDSESEYCALGRRLVWEGRPDAAIAVLQHALTLFPQSPLVYGALGSAHLENHDRQAAMACYETVLELLPEHRGAADRLRALRR
ncbi:MAG: MBL fold metallo-hydrolase [Candidatus Eiseniibacteriota bacterium]|jgi:glyoxylase-like metal-dependent hydrolase (beta-lactamase superfamily II)